MEYSQMAKSLTMKGIFKLLEAINHTPQEGLSDKVRTLETVVVKLG
tara:strand:- start:181 stop:318 length:138 start_codon:yes stop_codon:yes gene_type:complete